MIVTDRIKTLAAAQITDKSDLTNAIHCQFIGAYGKPVFVAFDDGRWACFNRSASGPILSADLPSADDLHQVALLTDAEYSECTGYRQVWRQGWRVEVEQWLR